MQATVKKYIILKIQSGEWSPGCKIPSIKALSIKFNTARATIEKVLINLVACQIIYGVKRQGYFVEKDNFISPGDDFVGLKNKARVKTIITIKEKADFLNEEWIFFKDLFELDRQKIVLFVHKNYFQNELIKIALIGIPYDFYWRHRDLINDRTFFTKNYIEPRRFCALAGKLIYSRRDYLVSYSRPIPIITNANAVFTVSYDENDIPLEIAVAFIRHDFLKAKMNFSIK